MKTILLILISVTLISCSDEPPPKYMQDWDCGDTENKKLVKESFENCLKLSNASTSTCGSISQKLFCDLVWVKNKKYKGNYQ